MDDADRTHVVVGASGGTGSALVRELVGRGRRVRAVNRSGRLAVPEGVEVVAGLDAGDSIVVSPLTGLADGVRVTVQNGPTRIGGAS